MRCARVLRRASVLSLKLLVVISNIFHVIVTAVLDRGVVVVTACHIDAALIRPTATLDRRGVVPQY